MGSPIAYPLDVYNRISPIAGFQLPENTNGQICIVCPLGGVATNGAADLARDTYKWNATKKIFETDFTNLKTQVDRIISRGFSVFQIVLDNPSWDFQ